MGLFDTPEPEPVEVAGRAREAPAVALLRRATLAFVGVWFALAALSAWRAWVQVRAPRPTP